MEASCDYRNALKRCSETAKEEYAYAAAALDKARIFLQTLRRQTDDIVVKSAAYNGTATSDAKARLSELAQRLDAMTSDAIEDTIAALTRKKARLSKFTVTLFGRTMVGKSTIREAVTRGDGATIGKGSQRTTRDIREYEWNDLRIVDTPGIGAYEGTSDRDAAFSVIDESDLLLFLVSSDSIQDSSFSGMKHLRSQNKPMIFVLNVRLDLTQPVYMRRFLRSPESYLGDEAIQGHVARIRNLAEDELGMTHVGIVPIHAQAAFLATRPEHMASAVELHRASGIDALVDRLTLDVRRRGPIRRVRTILDGVIVKLMDIEEMLLEQEKLLRSTAKDYRDKCSELDTWFDSYRETLKGRIASSASDLTRSLRAAVSSFVDENIEKKEFRVLWNTRIRNSRIRHRMERALEQVLDEVRGRLEAFNREIRFEFEIGVQFKTEGLEQYDPFDTKRTLRWVSAGGAALGGVAAVAGLIGAANFWNPVGWIAGAVSLGALGFSWLFRDREKKLQRRKAAVTKEMRERIDEMERGIARDMNKWCYDNIIRRLVRGVGGETRQLCGGMVRLADAIRRSAGTCSEELNGLNRRLLVRCGTFVGEPRRNETIERVVRDPGMRTKFTWSEGHHDGEFCRQVGKALEEGIDGLAQAAQRTMIATALAPARVSGDKVYVNNSRDRAVVPLSKSEMGRAIGKGGHNVRLASRLLGIPIYVVNQQRWNMPHGN